LQSIRIFGSQAHPTRLVRSATMASVAPPQPSSASRDGGDAPSAAVLEAQLPKARALAEKFAKR
jgi:hypothetical protein